MKVKYFDYLPEEARIIRSEVFVKEQGFIEEFDEIDGAAKHIVIYEMEVPISTCRIYFNSTKQSFVIGRVAVVKEWRGKGIGERTLDVAEDIIKQDAGKSVMLSGQLQAIAFYEKQGYKKQGEVHFEEECPHIWMKKDLGGIDK
ncbi:GNAT family N-acetyltransferase [Clostridium sp. SHJSY1]|uniref:GNAT family N-acetyltransferase n=1 Tax=Clostridium sp. SHJSY1 TaxID=2942483 RepID=UPI002875E88B|nr:GNAT family N-acetyltransferase [Clostridium sp. SHJSY1]MDS0525165.1 GNAT family N-acetyltransferase [Clostridium sp. SHJSY1]